MKIEIEIKAGTARRLGMIAATIAIVGAAGALYADQITFSSGQTLTATDLNNNFDELYARTTATSGGKSISVSGTYCGTTSQSFTGNLGGYEGAKEKCENTCSTSTAHMCTVSEIAISAQLGTAPTTTGRVTGELSKDCINWTDDLANASPSWGPSSEVGCATPFPLHCCD